MRNVDPTGRTPPCRASPFRTAPMPCSRTPKWMLRAPQLPAATSPPFLNTTLVEVARSADPPMTSGNLAASALSTLRSEEHTSELQSRSDIVCRLLLEKKNKDTQRHSSKKFNGTTNFSSDVGAVRLQRSMVTAEYMVLTRSRTCRGPDSEKHTYMF